MYTIRNAAFTKLLIFAKVYSISLFRTGKELILADDDDSRTLKKIIRMLIKTSLIRICYICECMFVATSTL